MLRSFFPIALLIARLDPPPPTPIDYQVCGAVHNGPLVPHVNPANLYPRRSDLA